MEYLYGASVQRIQEFIFQTNKLKEIVGASQLVDNICTSEFQKFCKSNSIVFNDNNIIVSAAGNIKYLLNETDCKKIVRSFPMHISSYAPGITISQAVVKVNGKLTEDIINKLEDKLKAQRNKADMPVDIGFMGLGKARRTGGVAYAVDDDNKQIDRGTLKKRKLFKEQPVNLFKKFKKDIKVGNAAFEMKHITGQSDNSWLAIIHADGNALGKKIQVLSKKTNGSDKVKEAFALFSKELELATQESAQQAFEGIIGKEWQKKIKDSDSRYPIRPVILGGDDLTVIIRADLAFDFVTKYLKAFESITKNRFKFMNTKYRIDVFTKGLTACAGIAYIKESYPFHYGVHLAESLTVEAKRFSKELDPENAPSSLSFYKVQASYIDDLKSMKERTHYAKKSGVSFDYGPYLISKSLNGFAHIDELNEKLEYLKTIEKSDSKGISKLRQWLSELHNDKAKADFMMKRMKSINKELFNKLKLDLAINNNKTIIQDLIHLHTFKTLTNDNKL